MENILERAKKDLKSYAKQNKQISFSMAIAISMLMTGSLVNADEVENTKKTIDSTVDTINSNISTIRRNNEKLLRDRTLELFQLEEQGDQVVKSPWESWQFGLEYTYGGFLGSNNKYSGKGDKKPGQKFERGSFASRYIRNKSNSVYGTIDLNLDNTYEEFSTSVINASIRPKFVNATAPSINLPVINPPAAPIINIALETPRPITPPAAPFVNAPIAPSAPTFTRYVAPGGLNLSG